MSPHDHCCCCDAGRDAAPPPSPPPQIQGSLDPSSVAPASSHNNQLLRVSSVICSFLAQCRMPTTLVCAELEDHTSISALLRKLSELRIALLSQEALVIYETCALGNCKTTKCHKSSLAPGHFFAVPDRFSFQVPGILVFPRSSRPSLPSRLALNQHNLECRTC